MKNNPTLEFPLEAVVEQLGALLHRGEFSFWEYWKCIPPSPVSSSLALLQPGEAILGFPISINAFHGESPLYIRPPYWQRDRNGFSVAEQKEQMVWT